MRNRGSWRLGVGPVFIYESLISARRWQGYAMRAGFLLLLLTGLVAIWNSSRTLELKSPILVMAMLGEWFYLGSVGVQLTLVFLAAPAATAGAICLDRARGTLTHMLMTDLSSAEIVLGKLASRLIPVLGLIACTLPLMLILSVMGGVDPNALLGAFLVTISIAFLGSSLALLLSLWAKKTHEPLLGTYAVWGVWLLWSQITEVAILLFPKGVILPPPPAVDPFWLAFAPYRAPRLVAWDQYAWFFGVTSGISALLVAVAVLRVRAIVTRESVKRKPSRSPFDRLCDRLAPGRSLPAPSLDWNPVFWRERHRSKPSRWARAVNILYFAIAAAFSFTAVATDAAFVAPWVNGLQVSAGLLVLSVTAAASLAEERARGSFDLLMTTTLSTRQIVLGKWLGTYRTVPLLTVLPAIVGFGFVHDKPVHCADVLLMIVYILCAGAAITSLGLAMATWLPRVGSAMAATVSVYVAITVGWFFMVLMLYPLGPDTEGLMMASPFLWTLDTTLMIAVPHIAPNHLAGWMMIWPLVMALAALLLLEATLRTFDRKLGRPQIRSRRFLREFFLECRRRLTLARPARPESGDFRETPLARDQNATIARSTYIAVRLHRSGIPFAGWKEGLPDPA